MSPVSFTEAILEPLPASLARAAVRITVQPTSMHRFRYKSEGRWAGSIPGVKRDSCPTIEINGLAGTAVVVVSCVTKDRPYRTHPHGVVARDKYTSDDAIKKGACKVYVQLTGGKTVVTFANIGIQSTTHNEIEDVLRIRQSMRVDPFKSGFSYDNLKKIDLKAVRLCFQVFLLDARKKPLFALPPVVSNVIQDKKTVTQLHIERISHDTGLVSGMMPMILLCKKVNIEDTAVVFVRKENGTVVWEAAAVDLHVHQHAAIAFTTPPYHDLGITSSVKVHVQLKRISDNEYSNSMDFVYQPNLQVSQRQIGSPEQQIILPSGPETNQRSIVKASLPSPGLCQENQYPHQGQTMMNPNSLQFNRNQQPISLNLLATSPHTPPLALCQPPPLTWTGDPQLMANAPMKMCYPQGQILLRQQTPLRLPTDIITPQPSSEPLEDKYDEEKMSISSDHFTGICDERISDSLSSLSLRSLRSLLVEIDAQSRSREYN